MLARPQTVLPTLLRPHSKEKNKIKNKPTHSHPSLNHQTGGWGVNTGAAGSRSSCIRFGPWLAKVPSDPGSWFIQSRAEPLYPGADLTTLRSLISAASLTYLADDILTGAPAGGSPGTAGGKV